MPAVVGASPLPVPPAVEVAFPSVPPHQRRWTVLLRLILLIPQAVAVFALSVGALVVGIIGWFGALFTGRLPVFAVDFLTGWLRWITRFYAYAFLLVDRYPPFTLDRDAAYPVWLEVEAFPLNRAAVFFRLILVLPANLLFELVSGGLAAVMVIIWLITLVAGRMPEPLYSAVRSVARYNARLTGYFWLLTPAYPDGLFGDPPGTPDVAGPGRSSAGPEPPWPTPPAVGGGSEPSAGAWGAPPPGSTSYPASPPGGWLPPSSPGAPAPPESSPSPSWPTAPAPGGEGWSGSPAAPAASPYPSSPPPAVAYPATPPPAVPYSGPPPPGVAYPGSPPVVAPSFPGGTIGPGWGAGTTPWAGTGGSPGAGLTWRIRPTTGAKWLLAIFIVLGVPVLISAAVIWADAQQSALQSSSALDELNSAYSVTAQDAQSFTTAVNGCSSQPSPFTCVQNADRTVAHELTSFAGTVSGIDFPSSVSGQAAALEASTRTAAGSINQLASAATPQAYEQLANTIPLQSQLDAIDQDYRTLATALGAS